MVYTDGIHLVADSIEELHEFAQKIGLKRCWYQSHRFKHYDLWGKMSEKTLTASAIKKTSKEIVRILRSKF